MWFRIKFGTRESLSAGRSQNKHTAWITFTISPQKASLNRKCYNETTVGFSSVRFFWLCANGTGKDFITFDKCIRAKSALRNWILSVPLAFHPCAFVLCAFEKGTVSNCCLNKRVPWLKVIYGYSCTTCEKGFVFGEKKFRQTGSHIPRITVNFILIFVRLPLLFEEIGSWQAWRKNIKNQFYETVTYNEFLCKKVYKQEFLDNDIRFLKN